MSLEGGRSPSRGGSGQDLWPKWMWFAVPVLVVVVVAGLWWAIFSPGGGTKKTANATPTVRLIRTALTQSPTQGVTAGVVTATQAIPLPPTATPTPSSPTATVVPTAVPTAEGLAIGHKATVINTGGSGLNMRTNPGKSQSRVKTLREGSIVEIIGGPNDADGIVWWNVRDEAGISGWVAGSFLTLRK